MTTDKNLLKSRFAASFNRYNALAVVQEDICARLMELVELAHIAAPQQALEVGSGTGFLTRRLLQRYPHCRWTINDLAEESAHFVAGYLNEATTQNRFLWGDAESLCLPTELDLVATASTVQWFDALDRFVERTACSLKSGGHLVMSSFGPENFREIKATTGEGLNYLTADQLVALLEGAGFQILTIEQERKQLTFVTPTDVLRHIKATGVNALHKTSWTKQMLADFEQRYRTLYPTPQGGVTLTYHPILVVAQRD